MNMQMSFSWALPITVVFETWVVNDANDCAWTCAVVALMGFSRQFLSALRRELAAANVVAKPRRPAGGDERLLGSSEGAGGGGAHWLRAWVHLGLLKRSPALLRTADAILFFCAMVLSYINMLVVMTYNPGLLLAIVAGETAGMLALTPMAAGTAEEEEEACCQ
jgi:hypothetical protein